MSQLPEHVDVIIIGTGLTNSILAAACSRIGKSVLHLDENSYYGNDWASFTFQQMLDWIKEKYPQSTSLIGVPEELINKSRMFCLDLAPRFLFSNGDMVDLLVKSNVARYHEFKNNIRILCLIGDDIQVMPCRRNEVFTSTFLSSLADKRRLMKFVELCLKADEETGDSSVIAEHGSTPIAQYLEDQGLKANLREYITNSIAMVRPSEPLRNVCNKIKKFMIATERYGRSPFLFPLYGCGEFPQSFCRLSAVFGGIYCLNTRIKCITTKSQTKSMSPDSPTDQESQNLSRNGSKFSVTFGNENHIVSSDMLVLEKADTIKPNLIELNNSKLSDLSAMQRLSRSILITRESIVAKSDGDTDLVSFLRIPSGETNTVFLMELNSSALVCPKEMNIVYLWMRSSGSDPEADLKATIERIFRRKEDCILWRFYYQQLTSPEGSQGNNSTSGSLTDLHITSPECDDIDYTNIIKEAERLFSRMCPDQEFLPRAPDPDEIIST